MRQGRILTPYEHSKMVSFMQERTRENQIQQVRARQENNKYSVWDTWKKRKRLNDAGMVPDHGFVRQLKALDPELNVVWDWGKEKWEIWRLTPGKPPIHMLTVQTKDKQYRELSTDVLVKLQAGDPTRYSFNELVAYWEEMDRQIARRKEKEFTDKIEAIATDTWRNVHCKIIQVPQEVTIRKVIANG